MIILHGFGKKLGVVDVSPFVVKVDLFLRMSRIPFQVDDNVNNIKNSPKGKLPFIIDNTHIHQTGGRDPAPKVISDSAHIFEYLIQTYAISLDNFLTPRQHAQGHVIVKTLDEHLRWCLMYSRWVMEDTWAVINQTFFDNLSFPLKTFIPKLIRKNAIKSLHAQGMGRHSKEEILHFAEEDFTAISVLLGDNQFLFGDKITSYDAVVYAHLCQFISVDIDNEFNQLARSYDNLVAYCQRIEQKFY